VTNMTRFTEAASASEAGGWKTASTVWHRERETEREREERDREKEREREGRRIQAKRKHMRLPTKKALRTSTQAT